MEIIKLKFSSNNSKMKKLSKATGKKVYAFDLPAGWSCPAAKDCLSKAHKITGKIKDGKDAKFRCYAASLEAAFPATRKLRWHNFDLLRNTSNMHTLIQHSMPADAEIIRIHSSGDFFNQAYFNAWLKIAKENPTILFYGYTKRVDLIKSTKVPGNLILVISQGGTLSGKTLHGMITATVVTHKNYTFPVFDVDEQSELHIINGGGSFGLMIHGTQPAGWNGNTN